MPDDEVEQSDEALVKRQWKVLDSHIAQLAEHFDSVQVVVTSHCPQTGTSTYGAGSGNYYARLASVDNWVRAEKRK